MSNNLIAAKDFCGLSSRQRRRLVKREIAKCATEQILCNDESLGEPTAKHSHLNETDDINTESLEIDHNEEIFSASVSSPDENSCNDQLCDDIDNANLLDSNPKVQDENFQIQLRKWVMENNLSHNAVSQLLKILRKVDNVDTFRQLPSDARTLMKTPRVPVVNLSQIHGEKYVHFGVANTLKQQIMKYSLLEENQILKIVLDINIDGVPISKSSGAQFWPILGSLVLSQYFTQPFVVGIFYGLCKPTDPNLYLKPFVDEIMAIKTSKTKISDKYNVDLQLRCFICDAPARAMISGVKYHTGYFGCSKCICEGDFIENRVVFPELDCTLRDDKSFKNRNQIEHHRHDSILENLDVGMVGQFPL